MRIPRKQKRPTMHTEIMLKEGIDPAYNNRRPTIILEQEQEFERTKNAKSIRPQRQ